MEEYWEGGVDLHEASKGWNKSEIYREIGKAEPLQVVMKFQFHKLTHWSLPLPWVSTLAKTQDKYGHLSCTDTYDLQIHMSFINKKLAHG